MNQDKLAEKKDLEWKRTREFVFPFSEKKKYFGKDPIPEEIVQIKGNMIYYTTVETFADSGITHKSNEVIRWVKKSLPARFFGSGSDVLYIPKSAINDFFIDAIGNSGGSRGITILIQFTISEDPSEVAGIAIEDLNEEEYRTFKAFFPRWLKIPPNQFAEKERSALNHAKNFMSLGYLGNIFLAIFIMVISSNYGSSFILSSRFLFEWISCIVLISLNLVVIRSVLHSDWPFDRHVINRFYVKTMGFLYLISFILFLSLAIP